MPCTRSWTVHQIGSGVMKVKPPHWMGSKQEGRSCLPSSDLINAHRPHMFPLFRLNSKGACLRNTTSATRPER